MGVQSNLAQVNSIFTKPELKGGTNGLLCDHKYNYSMHTYWKRQVKAKTLYEMSGALQRVTSDGRCTDLAIIQVP